MTTELLAPAGDSDCAFAALHYGADAVYLGLKRFSARAEAGNFSADQLSEVVAYAHSLTPRRSVYVAINTLILDREVEDVLEALMTVAEAGVDALIVQDLGVARLARLHFPGLRLHASTQLAIHNLEGARAARECGFSRVTLARELTLPEIGDITANSGLETETFIHGALCYCYSGLCLYSAVLRGRSGNRGRCAYPCRDVFTRVDGRGAGLAFSMLDLALPEAIPELKRAGVASLKIEGRKKSALYVASAVDFYRRLLDGQSLKVLEQQGLAEDIRTVFSRPWTGLYLSGRQTGGVIDPDFVGHRGARIGTVSGVVRLAGADWVQFVTGRRLERHDGIQIDLTGAEKPFGFAVDRIQVMRKGRGWAAAYEAERRDSVLVQLPSPVPVIPAGAAVYCSASQAVKQRYGFTRPRPGVFRLRSVLDVDIRIDAEGVIMRGRVAGREGVEAEVSAVETLDACKDVRQVEASVTGSFGKLGNTAYEAGRVAVDNRAGRFVPVSLVNRLRRELVEALQTREGDWRAGRLEAMRADEAAGAVAGMSGGSALSWIIKTDRVTTLEGWTAEDWAGVADVVVGIEVDDLENLKRRLEALVSVVGRERVRLAMPLIMREWDRPEVVRRIRALRDCGYDRWELPSLAGLPMLREGGGKVVLTADWPLYAMNRSAIRMLVDLGFERVTLSPEGTEENIRDLLAGHADRLVLPVYQDPPLFISESCPQVALSRDEAGKGCGGCGTVEYESRAGERVIVLHRGCRTIVIPREPLSMSGRIGGLRRGGLMMARVDFVWRPYLPEEAVAIWRRFRSGDVG